MPVISAGPALNASLTPATAHGASPQGAASISLRTLLSIRMVTAETGMTVFTPFLSAWIVPDSTPVESVCRISSAAGVETLTTQQWEGASRVIIRESVTLPPARVRCPPPGS